MDLTTQKDHKKASLKTAAQELVRELGAFRREDRPRFTSCVIDVLLGWVLFLMPVLRHGDQAQGFAFWGLGGVMGCLAIGEVQSWRLGQLRRRLDALEAQSRVGAGGESAPGAAKPDYATGPAGELLSAPAVEIHASVEG